MGGRKSSSSMTGDESALVDEILSDARTKADRIRRRAEREAQSILKRCEEENTAFAEKVTLAAKRNAERETSLSKEAIAQEVRRFRLNSFEDAIEGLFVLAEQRLLDKGSYDYRKSLKELCVDAIFGIRCSEAVVMLSSDDVRYGDDGFLEEVKADAANMCGCEVELTVRTDSGVISAGPVVLSVDGSKSYDNSLSSRLSRKRPELRRKLANLLFGKSLAETQQQTDET